MRRGREEDFAVVLCLPQLPSGGCGLKPHPGQTGIVPVSFQFDAPQGVTIKYRDGRKYRSLASGAPIPYHHGTKVLLLKMRAQADAPLGEQKLHGTLTFRAVQRGKPDSTEQIAVDFKVSLGDDEANAEEYDWPFGSHIGRHMKTVAMAPLFPFAAIVFMIACGTGQCEI
jgi:hypothetical protein